MGSEPTLVLTVANDRPGHRRTAGKPRKDGLARIRWERVLHPNARCHWTVKREVKRKDEDTIAIAAMATLCRHPQSGTTKDMMALPLNRASVEVVLYVAQKRRRDDDGLGYTVKGVLDGLVKCGVLVDDSRDHIDLSVDVVVDKARAPSYEVRITSEEDERWNS